MSISGERVKELLEEVGLKMGGKFQRDMRRAIWAHAEDVRAQGARHGRAIFARRLVNFITDDEKALEGGPVVEEVIDLEPFTADPVNVVPELREDAFTAGVFTPEEINDQKINYMRNTPHAATPGTAGDGHGINQCTRCYLPVSHRIHGR